MISPTVLRLTQQPQQMEVHAMKARIVLMVFTVLIPSIAFGRFLNIQQPDILIKNAKLVFVGRVISVKPSSLWTHLTYPTWEGVKFRWLAVDVEVMEPFKGVRKWDIVHTAMLSVGHKGSEPMYCPPGMLEPEKGDVFFSCLGPTPQPNLFAALSAPYDEDLSVFSLHRNNPNEHHFGDMPWLSRENKGFGLIFGLVDNGGKMIPAEAKKFRETYAKEIAIVSTNNMVYLEWERYVNQAGWQRDGPKGVSPTTNGLNGQVNFSPVTFPASR